LPVRIELEGYDPDINPLFTGTSVVPYVYTKEPPTGPDAGKFLQTYAPQSQTTGVLQNSPSKNK
jgi:membrane fusion protein (multidrug efflux system)